MKKQSGFTVIELIFVIIIFAGIGGWIGNIVKLTSASFDPLTGLVVLRAIGVFIAPLGAVMGFI